jgi:hypothetical protein
MEKKMENDVSITKMVNLNLKENISMIKNGMERDMI